MNFSRLVRKWIPELPANVPLNFIVVVHCVQTWAFFPIPCFQNRTVLSNNCERNTAVLTPIFVYFSCCAGLWFLWWEKKKTKASFDFVPVLYCIVLYCIVLYCIALHCIALHCIVLSSLVLSCLVLSCLVLALSSAEASYSRAMGKIYPRRAEAGNLCGGESCIGLNEKISESQITHKRKLK